MKPNAASNSKMLKAYARSTVDLWDQNFVNGKYIIAYELSPGLSRTIQDLLPKVRFQK